LPSNAGKILPPAQASPEPGLEILSDNIDEGPYVILQLRWSGDEEQPDVWGIQWEHYINYLGYNTLANYLYRYAPAPHQLFYTLLDSLPPELKKCFR
jgi:hypothetical protein